MRRAAFHFAQRAFCVAAILLRPAVDIWRVARPLKPKLAKLNLDTRWAAMHCFRRFRSSVLKKNRCPDDLAKFWLGHQNRDITDDYAEQLREDLEWRQQIVAAIGLGFALPQTSEPQDLSIAPNAPKMPECGAAEIAV